MTSLIQSADICILLGEIGCALLHTSKSLPTLLVTYAMTYPFYTVNGDIDHTVTDYPNKADKPKDIWPWIEKVTTDELYRKEMLEKQEKFHYIDENTMTFEQEMKAKTKSFTNKKRLFIMCIFIYALSISPFFCVDRNYYA